MRRGDPGVGDRKGARVEATSFFFLPFLILMDGASLESPIHGAFPSQESGPWPDSHAIWKPTRWGRATSSCYYYRLPMGVNNRKF